MKENIDELKEKTKKRLIEEQVHPFVAEIIFDLIERVGRLTEDVMLINEWHADKWKSQGSENGEEGKEAH